MASYLLSFLFLSVTLSLAIAEKPMHFHFYQHKTVSGSNPSAVKVAKGPIPLPVGPYSFGDIIVLDDPLTSGPEPTSPLLGRAQGLYSVMNSPTVTWVFNIVLTCGEYNGSTIAIMGRDDIPLPVRELSVVGGSGAFRMARGYVLLKTYSVDIINGDAELELDVYVYPAKL
ncbi:Dirigent protein [Rhynchospora pubera]|uniref:Dirigent protein n=1 Tax=Rhynchospora pubera TaxID=906938 RepID=A0AAV8CP75_9POAL|nr:Dirigent protein [Rhynchospora pubera]KAJ4790365.1 Dirigent protein [Rhynchospora pubera]